MGVTKRMTWNRFLIVLLAFCTAFGLLIQTETVSAAEGDAEEGTYYYDGTYQGTAYGYRSDVTVEISIVDHKIASITEVSQGEDAAYWKRAKKLFSAITEAGSLDVDTVSGATISSNAILEAAKQALDQALSAPDSPFVSGDGSAESPYTIVTAAKLAQFAKTVDEGESYAGKYIVLDSDMNLSEYKSWNPIGDEADGSTAIFSGIFDGQGHVITGLRISGRYAQDSNLGLFSALGKQAQVLDLTLQDAAVQVKGQGLLRSGLIAGAAADGAAIDSCTAVGSMNVTSTGKAPVYAGGLVGHAGEGAVIANSWTETAIDAASQGGTPSAYAGGLVGMSEKNSVIVNNASFGEETASAPASTEAGGLAGGLAAMTAGYAYNNYAVGPASIVSGNAGDTWVGALAGQVTTDGMTAAGGSYAYPQAGALRANNYYAQDAGLSATKSGAAVSVAAAAAGTGASAYDTLFTGTKLTMADMAEAAFADTMNDTLVETAQLLAAYKIENIALKTWKADGGYAIPTGKVWTGAAATNEAGDSIFAGGKGTKKSPYIIDTADQLRAFAASMNAGETYANAYITMGSDIDLTGTAWSPIIGTYFQGSFDGAGHTIKGLAIGSEAAPYEITEARAAVVGFLPRLDETAVVKNLHFEDAYVNAVSNTGLQAGVLSGYAAGAIIDGCSVQGTMHGTSGTRGNAFVGGLIGRLDEGAIINSMTDAEVICENTAAWVEAGAITGMNNGGLIANAYSLGTLQTKTGEDNNGYSMGSLIAGYQGGDMVNCYAAGNLSSTDKTEYSGILAGWMRGYARTYNCWYNQAQTMTMAGESLEPARIIGIWPTAYTDDEGLYYIGGLAEGLNAYKASDVAALVSGLNAGLEECPINIEDYGVALNALKKWTAAGGTAVLSEEAADYSYLRPDWEEVPQKEVSYKSGIWYGRSDDKSSVVALTISDNEVTKVEILSGAASGEAYDEAAEKAKEKAIYGDTSTYDAADPSMFAGGSGTKEDPYQIANEVQLRYLAHSINEDVDWIGTYFKQTDDIKLSKADWTPIGWGIMAEIKSTPTIYAQYPFRGCYDGGDYTISGLTMGSEANPITDPAATLAVGLFGIVEGDEQTNDTPQDPETRYVELKNIHLEGVSIHAKAGYDSYVGSLVGDPELGFRAVDCSAEGTIAVTTETGDLYMGGLLGYPLRGLVENCWTNMDVTGHAAGAAYVGGLCGMDNRVTSVNCFSMGNVTAGGDSIYVGGLSGDFAGFRHNCYTSAKVTAESTTDYIGAVNGTASAIGAENGIYYSDKAVLTAGGETIATQANGYSAGAKEQNVETPQADMGQALCDVLNANNAKAYESLMALSDAYKDINHHGHGMYYADEKNAGLRTWAVNSLNQVSFADAAVTPGDSLLSTIAAVTEAKTLTAEDAAAVDAAISAYGLLTDAQKAALPKDTEKTLQAAKEQVAALVARKPADQAAAAAVEAQLLAVNAADTTAAAKAMAAYDALTDAQKTYVSNDALNKYNAVALAAAKAQLAQNSGSKALQQKVAQLTVKAKTVKGVKAKAQKKKKAKISWKSLGKGYTYEVYRSTKLNKGYKKVSKTKKTKVTVKKLKAKKTYYVKVRAFKKVNGKKVYTGYSDVITFKAKK